MSRHLKRVTNDLKKLDFKSETMTVQEFRERIVDYQESDREFQAAKSEDGRWKKEDNSAYLVSVQKGSAPSMMIYADVRECLAYALQKYKNLLSVSADTKEVEDDIKYYQKWLEGKDKHAPVYLNIDSANRNRTIDGFFNNEKDFVLPAGEYACSIPEMKGFYRRIELPKATLWKNLPQEIQNDFMRQSEVNVTIYTNCSRSDLSLLFQCVNKSVSLNPAEKRNSVISSIATTVRDIAHEKETFNVLVDNGPWSKNEDNRRQTDQFIAECANTTYHGGEVPSINLDKLYEPYRVSEADCKKFDKLFRKFRKVILPYIGVSTFSGIQNSLYDLYRIFLYMEKNNIEVVDVDAFLKGFVAVVMDLIDETVIDPVTKKKVSRTYDDPSWKKGPRPFKRMKSGMQKTNCIWRMKLIRNEGNVRGNEDAMKFDLQDDEFLDALIDEGIVLQKDRKRTLTGIERTKFLYMRKWTTVDGHEVPLTEAGKIHICHATPHSDGGKTDDGNLYLDTAENNQRLGNNPYKQEE